jgi:excisionase family DNA binding protein
MLDGSVASLHVLASLLDGPCTIVDETGKALGVPANLAEVLRAAVLSEAAGPADDELSTEEAARMLGVSRPTLIRLLDAESIPYRLTAGQHRRISRRAIAEFRRRDLARQQEALDALAADAEEFGFFD